METLQARIDAIAAQEREWAAQGYPVLIVSQTVEWWNERGIYTAADLDAHFAGDPHESDADRNYHMAMEYEAVAEDDFDLSVEIVEDNFPFCPIYAVAEQFQPGWL